MSEESFVTMAEFDEALKKLGYGGPHCVIAPRVAVGVSGGGDSMALAFLMQEWVNYHDGEMISLTVDHQLRDGARAEAESVQKVFEEHGMNHAILTWEGPKPATRIQEAARDARYRLLTDYCNAHGYTMLAVAHNLEDQAETFWMRLAHGSGIDGLAGIAGVRHIGGVALIRPVLGFSRARLRATCARYRVGWIEDPSNSNEKYLRVKLREFEEMLATEGFTPQRLSATLQKLEDARDALQTMTAEAAGRCLTLHPEGYATLHLKPWRDLPRDIQRRVLTQALQAVSPQAYPPGFEAVEATRLDLQKLDFAGKTLHGCELLKPADDAVTLVREAAIVEPRVPAANGVVWDHRFTLAGLPGVNAEIGPLGEEGIAALRRAKFPEEKLKQLPSKARRMLPAFWHNDNLCAVPHLNYYSDDCPAALREGEVAFRGTIV